MQISSVTGNGGMQICATTGNTVGRKFVVEQETQGMKIRSAPGNTGGHKFVPQQETQGDANSLHNRKHRGDEISSPTGNKGYASSLYLILHVFGT